LVVAGTHHDVFVDLTSILLVALGMRNVRHRDFLKKLWVVIATVCEISKAHHGENVAVAWHLRITIESDRTDSTDRRVEPHDHEVILLVLRVVIWVRDMLDNAASLGSVVDLSSLEGTDDDASRDIISATVGSGQNDVIVDQTGSAATFPLYEVWVLALESLISADDATGLFEVLLCMWNRLDWLGVTTGVFEVRLCMWNRLDWLGVATFVFEVRLCMWNRLDWFGVTGPFELAFLDLVESSCLGNVQVVSGDRA
jgi:hypothetical protein